MNLENLIEKYNEFYKENNFNICPTVWNTKSNYIKNSFNLKFRGENAYVWQEQLGDKRETYTQYYKKIKDLDKDKLLEKTKEDGSYGCITYDIDDILISRDLLDSILEIYFLASFFPHLNNMTFLEIGGGYGRLCKRFTDCFPESNYLITDGIPQSTYYSKIYLNNKSDQVINLFDIMEMTKNIRIDVAVNIHSFPECNINDIKWWIAFICSRKIKYIFYVPNNPNSTPEYIPTNSGDSILDIFKDYDYQVVYFKNMYSELNIKYSYAVPFFIMMNSNF